MLEPYLNWNAGCYHSDKLKDTVIEVINYIKGVETKVETTSNILLIVLKGSACLSFGHVTNKTIQKGDILLLPAFKHIGFNIEENTSVLAFRLNPSVRFCDHFSIDSLSGVINKNTKKSFLVIKANKRISAYINSLIPCLMDGLTCQYFLELKTKELFFILRAYNTKSDLAAFFSPMITKNSDFYTFVLDNYKTLKTIKKMANKANISVSGFEKCFKRVFGTTFGNWTKEQMRENLYYEITRTKKSFREISKILDMTEGNVYQILFRGRRELKKLVEKIHL